jgi:hypothetical protein
MADKFFAEEPVVETETTESETIKLGDAEYTQDELNRLVELGKLGSEAEEKYNTKLDKVWPDYTKKSQENIELKKQIEELSKPKPEPVNPTFSEDQRILAKNQLKELLGGEPMTREEFNTEVDKQVMLRLQAKDLIADTEKTISEMETEGYPKTNVDDLLKHMSETGIKSPKKAYKDMFEEELDKIKESKLAGLRQPGLVTNGGSTAGSKEPQPVLVTESNLSELLKEALKGQG